MVGIWYNWTKAEDDRCGLPLNSLMATSLGDPGVTEGDILSLSHADSANKMTARTSDSVVYGSSSSI